MTNRKCGTCRFFEEGGIAASGWCRHPERQDLQHMVLVRKTELACRDGWDHDLWEPAEKLRGNRPPESLGTPDLIPAPAASSVEASGTQESDAFQVVDGRLPWMSRSFQAAGPVDAGDEQDRDRDGIVPGDLPKRPVKRAASHDPFSGGIDSGHDQVQGETISTRGFGARFKIADRAQETTAPSQKDPGTSSETRDSMTQPIVDSGPSTSRRGSNGNHSDPIPRIELTQRFGSLPSDYEVKRSPAVEQSGLTERFDIVDEDETFMGDATDSYIDAPPGQSSFEPEEPGSGEVEDPDLEELKLSERDGYSGIGIRIPLEVRQEQRCRTCRDFRPTDGGARGWCNNQHAFDKPTRVDANGLACQGTFGSWWTPADDWWMERADISHHSAPTPNVEELIRVIRAQRQEGVDA